MNQRDKDILDGIPERKPKTPRPEMKPEGGGGIILVPNPLTDESIRWLRRLWDKLHHGPCDRPKTMEEKGYIA